MQHELDHLKKLFGLSEHDVALKGYQVLTKLLQEQIDYLNKFSIKGQITQDKKESVEYDRAQKLWSDMPDLIAKVRKLKDELGVTPRSEVVDAGAPITPETM